jgi:hypothetical protein
MTGASTIAGGVSPHQSMYVTAIDEKVFQGI